MADEKPVKPPPKQVLQDLIANRLRPAFEKTVNQVNAMNAREKMMIIGFASLLVIAVDYWILMRPIMQTFQTTLPELATVETQASGLRDDKKNQELIRRSWTETRADLARREKSFIAPDELPQLLENLSGLAQGSHVKILTLMPVEVPSVSGTRYRKAAIRISATAGTHDLGHFLSRLESGVTFFRVINLSINDNPQDMRRHQVDLDLEVYTYGSPASTARGKQ